MYIVVTHFRTYFRIYSELSLRSWRDFVRECFCFGSEAVNASGEAVRRLVKSTKTTNPRSYRHV